MINNDSILDEKFQWIIIHLCQVKSTIRIRLFHFFYYLYCKHQTNEENQKGKKEKRKTDQNSIFNIYLMEIVCVRHEVYVFRNLLKHYHE